MERGEVIPHQPQKNFVSDGRDTAVQVRRAADPECYFMIDEDMGDAGGIFQSIQD